MTDRFNEVREEVLALTDAGMTVRACPCPGHLMLRCADRSCCCLRHRGTICSGVILLDVCSSCGKGGVTGEERNILECGCVQCLECSVTTLIGKPWARDLSEDELLKYFDFSNRASKRRVQKLIRQERGRS